LSHFGATVTTSAKFAAGLSVPGNYVAKFERAPSGQDGAGRVMLTQSYTGSMGT
jgi:hypothetical protein